MRADLTIAFAISVLGLWSAHAEEPVGCDKFRWPIDQARAALTASDIAQLQSGGELASPPSAAIVGLQPLADADLPKQPERGQRPESFAGFVKMAALPAGTYLISLSDGAWIDVIQNGAYLRPKGFSGATGCSGIRKTIKFTLSAAPVTIQISGATKNTIHLAIQPAAD